MKTNITNDQKNNLTNELFLQNQIKINKIFSIVMMAFAIVIFAITTFSFTGLYHMGMSWCRTVMMISSIAIFLIALFTFLVKLNTTLTTIILNSCLICFGAILYFLYSTTMMLFAIPILIATMYFRKRAIIFNSIVVLVVYIFVLQLSVYLEKVSPLIQELHVIESVVIYQYPQDLFAYIFIPRLVILLISTLLGLFASDNGKTLISNIVQKNEKLSIVKHELDTAAKIQKDILPKNSFTTQNLEIDLYASMTPAKETAGDFYDYFYVDNKTLCFVVGDVSDKGLAAAMYMMVAKSNIKSIIQNTKDLKKSIELVNNILCDSNEQNMFTTLWIGYINLTNGDVEYINAGHPYPIIKHSDGTITTIENDPNLFIGAFKDIPYDVGTFNLKTGDKLFLYTDGATDAINQDNVCFGTDRLYESLKKDYNSNQDLCNGVINDIHNYSNKIEQFDDITVMSLERMENAPCDNEIVLFAEEGNIDCAIDIINDYIKGKCGKTCRRDIDVIIDEVLANICSYATNNINMVVRYEINDNVLSLTFIDNGQEFNPLTTSLDKQDVLSLGGNGIMLIKSLTDGISYERLNNQNILKVTKILKYDTKN